MMTFEETFQRWTLDQKVEWALGPNICNLSTNMRSIIVDLKAENERLKGELQQSATNCNKLKCLALHAMSELFYYKRQYLELLPVSIDYAINKYFDLWVKFSEAYHKAKKELKYGKIDQEMLPKLSGIQ